MVTLDNLSSQRTTAISNNLKRKTPASDGDAASSSLLLPTLGESISDANEHTSTFEFPEMADTNPFGDLDLWSSISMEDQQLLSGAGSSFMTNTNSVDDFSTMGSWPPDVPTTYGYIFIGPVMALGADNYFVFRVEEWNSYFDSISRDPFGPR